jgi:glutamate decarboxylase
MEGDRLIMTPEEVLKRVDENTIGVVPTLGVTFTCQYEPVEAVSQALDQLQAQTGLDIPIHVDAASGGFLAPFIDPELVWDFRLQRVRSINSSGHKFGLAPLGVGWVIWRDTEDLPEDLIFNVNYLGGNMATFALNFSRPGGQIIAQYYNFLRLGREGYRKIHEASYDTAKYLAHEIANLGPFELIYPGRGGIPAVAWKLKDGVNHGFNLFDLADRLRVFGWQVPAYTLPPHREDLAIQRIIVRHDLSRDLASLLLGDFKQALSHLDKHASVTPLSATEATGFNHN